MAAKDARLQLRCTSALLDHLDEWRSRERPIPSRSEAVRHLAARGAALEACLPVMLRESAAELLSAGVVSPQSEKEIYTRWSVALIQALDRLVREESRDRDQAQETPAPDTAAPSVRRAIR